MSSAADRPIVGRTLLRARVWSAVLCLSLVAGLLLLPATTANAAGFVVTSDLDSGLGTLRQAILDANANPGYDTITFEVGTPLNISPSSSLPPITEGVTIDGLSRSGQSSCATWPPTLTVRLRGSSAGAGTSAFTVADGIGTVIEGFVIRNFAGDGISVDAPASGTRITCNAIGTTAIDSTVVQGNDGAGIAVRGTGALPSTIDSNIIMYNGGAGILVDTAARLVSLRGNRIMNNGGLGIDLIDAGNGGPTQGGNDLQPSPTLTDAFATSSGTSVTGFLTTSATPVVDGRFVIEFFDSPSCDDTPAPGGFGEGATPIGSVAIQAGSATGPGTFSFTANGLSSADVGDVITATATDDFGAGNTSEFSACMPVVQGSTTTSADLSVTGSVTPDPIAGGDPVTYSLVVHNDGPGQATGVVIENELPVGIDFDSAASTSSCSANVLTVTCNLGTIDPGDPNDVTVSIGGTAQDIGGQIPLDDTATVSGSVADPDPLDNATTIKTMLSARQVDLSVTKDGPATVKAGQSFSYAIGVANAGPDPAHAVVVTDALPKGVAFVDVTPPSGWTCGESAGEVTCSLGVLETNAPASIDLQVKASSLTGSDPLEVSNTASVTSDRTDLVPDDNESAAVKTTITPVGGADLTVTSVSNTPNPVTGGYDVGYSATVKNLGPGGATKVVLTDVLAAGESFVAAGSDPRCTAMAALVTCSLGAIPNGADSTLLIVTKTPVVSSETVIHDRFTASAPEDGTHGNDALDVATTVRPRQTDWAAGYVPVSSRTTWITDATQWWYGDPVATVADPTMALVGIPGGGPGGPVTITEAPCAVPFACLTRRPATGTNYPAPKGVLGSLVTITVPRGYGASNPVAGVVLDNWSLIPPGWEPFRVSYQDRVMGSFSSQLPWCGGWSHSGGPPCVAELHRVFSWWNPYMNGDLLSVVRFTGDATIGRGR